jgi:hypothetical protein
MFPSAIYPSARLTASGSRAITCSNTRAPPRLPCPACPTGTVDVDLVDYH